MQLKILFSVACLAIAVGVSAESKAVRLRLVSEVKDGKSGFVYLDGKLVTLMKPGKNWEIELPNRLLDPIFPKNVEVAMCNTFATSMAPPPPWVTNARTAGALAITPQFMEREPVPFEVHERAMSILTFLESQHNPDFSDRGIRLIEWIKQTNELGVECDSAVKLRNSFSEGSLLLKNPLATARIQTFYIRGSRSSGYRLEK